MVGAGAVAGAYAALIEPRLYRLTTHTLELAHRPFGIDVLHLSDTHMRRSHHGLQRWLAELPDRLERIPDIVVATGDMIQDDSGIDPVVDALAGIEGRLGRFYVLGSHDYFQSRFQNYAKYWTGRRQRIEAPRADTERLEASLKAKGWISLQNRSEVVTDGDRRIRVSGVDDPYIRRHSTDHITRTDEDLGIALVHAPEVVSEWVLNGFDLVVGGHTHAGQVRIPFVGALVTNCDLPLGLAGGPHRVGHAWLHVSSGLGTGRFSPIRFNCRPEATLLRLRPSDAIRD